MKSPNGMTHKELLIGLHTDMKWIKKSLPPLKTLAVETKDRSLKNENDIKNFKWAVGIIIAGIASAFKLYSYFKTRIGG